MVRGLDYHLGGMGPHPAGVASVCWPLLPMSLVALCLHHITTAIQCPIMYGMYQMRYVLTGTYNDIAVMARLAVPEEMR